MTVLPLYCELHIWKDGLSFILKQVLKSKRWPIADLMYEGKMRVMGLQIDKSRWSIIATRTKDMKAFIWLHS